MTEQLGPHVDNIDRLRDLARNESVVEHIEVTPTGWHQTRWFADRDAFDEYRAFWQRNGQFRLHRLTRDGEGDDGDATSDGLTDAQREAVRTAHEMGYFEIPRTASLEAVADELGISASSLSERLRRAQSHLVTTHVSGAGRPDGS
jgi:predicted DNA binding protein